MKKRKKQKEKQVDGKEQFKNKPFAALTERIDLTSSTTDEPEAVVDSTPEEPVADEAPLSSDDTDFLSDMMREVVPLPTKKASPTHDEIIAGKLAQLSDDELVMRHLDELVYGDGEFDIADTDEFIEAHVRGLDRRIMRKLRRGEFPIQAHIDLHGLNRPDARDTVGKFIKKSYVGGLKCVLIVHGRGLGSPDRIPVLKEKLKSWLTRGAMGKKVLAYTSARPYDGGTGAVYVLLRS